MSRTKLVIVGGGVVAAGLAAVYWRSVLGWIGGQLWDGVKAVVMYVPESDPDDYETDADFDVTGVNTPVFERDQWVMQHYHPDVVNDPLEAIGKARYAWNQERGGWFSYDYDDDELYGAPGPFQIIDDETSKRDRFVLQRYSQLRQLYPNSHPMWCLGKARREWNNQTPVCDVTNRFSSREIHGGQ